MAPDRNKICRELGLGGVLEAHELITTRDTAKMMRTGLNAAMLQRLGYTADALRKLHFDDAKLEILGFAVTPAPRRDALDEDAANPGRDTTHPVFTLLKSGATKPEFHRQGYNIELLKKAGLEARECHRAGFDLQEIARAYSPNQLRRAGFGVRELRGVLRPDELRAAGFAAMDLRTAGFSIRELLAAGYNENAVRSAGFSNAELMREGLSRTTVDPGKGY